MLSCVELFAVGVELFVVRGSRFGRPGWSVRELLPGPPLSLILLAPLCLQNGHEMKFSSFFVLCTQL